MARGTDSKSHERVSTPSPGRRSDKVADSRTAGIRLQQTMGNQAVLYMSRNGLLQTSLSVSRPGDVHEREADKMAERLMSMPEPGLMRKTIEEEEEVFKSKPKTPGKKINSQLQRQANEEEEELLMPQLEDEEVLQMNKDFEDEELIQKQISNDSKNNRENRDIFRALDNGSPELSSNFESDLQMSKSGGSPLPEETRTFMESRFNSDFSKIKIHTGNNADKMNRELNAQAFTNNNHIFFKHGKYNTGSTPGRKLLAHELTHTIQQTGGRHLKKVQRAGEPENTNVYKPDEKTVLDKNAKTLEIPLIELPEFKGEKERGKAKFDALKKPINLRKGGREDTKQIEKWKTTVNEPVKNTIDGKITTAKETGGYKEGAENTYFFRAEKNKDFYFFGTRQDLIERALIPFWDKNGEGHTYQVDHIVEDQLGGEDEPDNYELLDATANMSSGSRIAREIRNRIKGALECIKKPLSPDQISEIPDFKEVKENYQVKVHEIDFTIGNDKIKGEPGNYWSLESINKADHLKILEPLKGKDLENLGEKTNPIIFSAPEGGVRLSSQFPKKDFLPRVDLLKVNLKDNPSKSTPAGTIEVKAFKQTRKGGKGRAMKAKVGGVVSEKPEMTWELLPVPGVYGGAIDKKSIAMNVRNSLRLPGLSPIELDFIDLDPEKGIIGTGKVLPTVPLIKDADIDIILEGDNIRLSKLFNTGEINLPPPFTISDSSLEVSLGTEGFGIAGEINFGITNIGEGFLRGATSSEGGFSLAGGFDFDTELFDPASIEASYENEILTVEGIIGIPDRKVKGIKSATITAKYSEGSFTANGSAELDIPGIERGELSVNYSETEFSIGGKFQLSSDIPGIAGGEVSANVRKVEGEEGYEVSVFGTARSDIPGIDTTLTISYENGIIIIGGEADYSRGMLSGHLQVGATNQAIDMDGNPTGKIEDNLRVYGGGDLRLRLTPWLEATAGVRLTPVGEIEVRGEIGLPSSVEIFSRKSIETDIFRMPTLEIPLFAIPLGPRSVGLVATISGGLTAEAGVGPGEITDLMVGITYNPAREKETRITGKGRLVIPANAGLRLYARAGIGISIALARVSGNIEVGGELGLDGAAEANVSVNWSPASGLEINAKGEIYVQPKFKFDVSLVLEASAFFFSYEWRKNLAEFEYGPDLRFGIRFPIHYKENEPFDISLDDVEFVVPEIDIPKLVRDLGKQIID